MWISFCWKIIWFTIELHYMSQNSSSVQLQRKLHRGYAYTMLADILICLRGSKTPFVIVIIDQIYDALSIYMSPTSECTAIFYLVLGEVTRRSCERVYTISVQTKLNSEVVLSLLRSPVDILKKTHQLLLIEELSIDDLRIWTVCWMWKWGHGVAHIVGKIGGYRARK